jgi:hypothetical protein
MISATAPTTVTPAAHNAINQSNRFAVALTAFPVRFP